jgi:hypothetical protein
LRVGIITNPVEKILLSLIMWVVVASREHIDKT